MKTSQIRNKFLDYFAKHGHTVVSSSPLVPGNDPTLLFTNSGMVQFKDTFLGVEPRDYMRAVSVQRCLRAGGKHNDLENVGYTARHHTFFEMMGNFSFGDYFKRDAIKYAWDFLTNVLGLPEEKLWVTVYKDDKEAEDIWLKEMEVSKDRFSRCGDKDNFWSMGDMGPCGPCSEIFYDHGEQVAGGPPGSPDEDGDRYIEIWNLVFMQFNRDINGKLNPLPKPAVDTGLGLERLAAILQGRHSNYDIDLFQYLMRAIAKVIGIKDHEHTSVKVIADHIRSCAFLAVDGVSPSNEGRGYVMRRIIRRALRHGSKLGAKTGFFHKLVEPLVFQMGEAYPELADAKAKVEKILAYEEDKFSETLEQGMQILEEYIGNMQGRVIAGDMAFKLYDTYGFPLDLTLDIAREKNLKIDVPAYEAAMEDQRSMARQASNFKADVPSDLKISGKSKFIGYDNLQGNAKILDLLVDGIKTDTIEQNTKAAIVLDKTPFYAESGGQVADDGVLVGDNGQFEITDVQKQGAGIIHFGQVSSGTIKKDDVIKAKVDKKIRRLSAANHSATHLLHAALREVLGEHVSQKGSLVNSERLRFDFSHFSPLAADEIQQVEDLVNAHIVQEHSVITEIMNMEAAKKSGAMALFGEKYSSKVRVLSMSDFSVELCGGTHVDNTANIGYFKIISETGIASGVRRIEAVAGGAAYTWLNRSDNILGEVARLLKVGRDEVSFKLQTLLDKQKFLDKQINGLNASLAKSQGQDLASKAVEVNGIKILLAQVKGMDNKGLRGAIDELKSKLGKAVVLLAMVYDDKVTVICGVTNNSTDVIKAGDVVRELTAKIDGKGGGRADMAQGGGNDVKALPKALKTTYKWIESRIKNPNV